ncbi:MAG: HAMP domain-containing histidine kinase [Proteobacteria bacterium]|nr:HAMP domain-containing histidine kinase [Pseudomonadota bacterium]
MERGVDPGLKRTLTAIAGMVAAATAVAIPALYLYTAYSYETDRIQRDANDLARTVSELVFTHPDTWIFNEHLQLKLLRVGHPHEWPLSHRLFDGEGELLVETGTIAARATVARSSDVSDGFKVVGRVEVIESIEHVWLRAGLAAIVGAVIALAMFAVLRVLPLRALTRALERLRASQEQLVATQGELLGKERLAAIGQVTATVGHELRNPLGSIRTALAVVRKLARGEDPMMKESLDISDRGVTRCDAIISDLLDFTRIQQLNREPTAIDRWLRTVLEEHDFPAPVRLRLELEAGIEMPLDRDRIRRVVVNVIDNACDAMDGKEPGGDRAPLLTVGTRVNGGRLEIAIRDTGHGMASEVAAKAFEPLYSTKAFGVGLGLPMVKNIMEQHGGGVDITSQEERGTEVVMWLPLAAEARGDAA